MNPNLKSTIHFYHLENRMYHVYDAASSRHFKMGEQEVAWLKLLDGTKDLDALRGRIPLEYFEKFIAQVNRLGLLEGSDSKPTFSPFKIKILNVNPSRLIDASGRFPEYYRDFLKWASLPIVVLNIVAIAMLSARVPDIRETIDFNAWAIVFYFISILLVGLIHEGSHALVARSFGVQVPSVGMMLFFLHPSFYADVSGINLLSNRNERVMVLLSGVLANNLMLFIGMLLMFAPLSESVLQYVLMFSALNLVLMLLNMVPFVEYDGYYVFQELLGEPRFSRNALINQVSKQSRRIEYVFYYHISHIFQFVLIVSIIVLLRRGVLMVWDSIWVDGIFLALIIATYPMLTMFRLKTVR